jgi:hypothetical protein
VFILPAALVPLFNSYVTQEPLRRTTCLSNKFNLTPRVIVRAPRYVCHHHSTEAVFVKMAKFNFQFTNFYSKTIKFIHYQFFFVLMATLLLMALLPHHSAIPPMVFLPSKAIAKLQMLFMETNSTV